MPYTSKMKNIVIEGQIEDWRTEMVADSMHRTTGRSALWINSDGGVFDGFSRFAPVLKRYGYTSIGRRVGSTALLFFLLGNERIALPDASFFFYEVALGFDDDTIVSLDRAERDYEILKDVCPVSKENIEWYFSERNSAQNWFLDMLCRFSGIPRSLFITLMRNEATLSAREAVHYGIAHRIMGPFDLIGHEYDKIFNK